MGFSLLGCFEAGDLKSEPRQAAFLSNVGKGLASLLPEVEGGSSGVKQMIMGAGKTTVAAWRLGGTGPAPLWVWRRSWSFSSHLASERYTSWCLF